MRPFQFHPRLGDLKSFTWEALGTLCWSLVSLAVDPLQSLHDLDGDDHWQFMELLQLEAVQRLNRAECEVRWGTLGQHLLSSSAAQMMKMLT